MKYKIRIFVADRCIHFITSCNTVRYIGTKTQNVYGAGTGQIWLEKVRCNGTERDIGDCSHNAWGVHSCEHHDDVAIFCSTGKPNRPGVTYGLM